VRTGGQLVNSTLPGLLFHYSAEGRTR
jgi:hypothetical protein